MKGRGEYIAFFPLPFTMLVQRYSVGVSCVAPPFRSSVILASCVVVMAGVKSFASSRAVAGGNEIFLFCPVPAPPADDDTPLRYRSVARCDDDAGGLLRVGRPYHAPLRFAHR